MHSLDKLSQYVGKKFKKNDRKTIAKCALCAEKLEMMVQAGATTSKEYNGNVSDIYSCNDCGHVQFYPLPTSELINSYYSSNSFYEALKVEPDTYHDQWFDENDLPHLLFIESLISLKKNYLYSTEDPNLYDYGCGYGGLIAKSQQLGFNCRGSDLDEACIAFSKSKGLSVDLGGLELLAKERNLDVITCYHSLEHFLNPQDFFDVASSSLSSQGFLVIAVPNGAYYPAQKDFFGKFDWCFFPEHLHYFTPNSIQNILIKNNFEITSVSSNSAAESQLDWLQKCSLTIDCDVSNIDLSQLYKFHDANLSSRDLRIVARKTKSPKSLVFSRVKFKLQELASGDIYGIVFSIKNIDLSLATPRLIVNVQVNTKLYKNYKVILHLRPKHNGHHASDEIINLDFYPQKSTSLWKKRTSLDICIPLLIDDKFAKYDVEVGLWDPELSNVYKNKVCIIGTISLLN